MPNLSIIWILPVKTYPSSELKQNLGDVLSTASREPVAITKHRKPRYVLMSLEAYEARFAKDPRRSFALEEMPSEHLEMIESQLDPDDA